MVAWLMATALLAADAANTAVEADFVVRGAMLYDGTGGEARRGDLAIRGDRIVGVGQFQVQGNPRVLAGEGLVVAPGFIDLHNHSDDPIVAEKTRANVNFLTQGVTTIVTGNCGGGRVDVAAYLTRIEQQPPGTNVAHLIPHGRVRAKELNNERRPASAHELAAMKQTVEEGMRAGAWGLSTGLIYVPSKYAATDELIELSRVVARHGGLYVSHMRNEGSQLLESIDELLRIGDQAGLPVHISHFKVSGKSAWGLARDAVQKVEAARQRGCRVTADQYPYIASSTSLAAMVLPDEYRGGAELTKALEDPESASRLRAALQKSLDARDGGESLFVASYAAQRAWQGKNLAQIAKQEQRSAVELVIEIQQHGGAQMVNFGMNEEEVRLIMRQPYVATASDGSAKVDDGTVPHPRSYGTFPRKIGRYAIEMNQLPVAQAIHASSGLPAEILGLPERGQLRAGWFADVVVFAPDELRDLATFDNPHQLSSGVRFLFVNGQLAIDGGQPTGVLAGRALRHVSLAPGQ